METVLYLINEIVLYPLITWIYTNTILLTQQGS